MTQKIEDKDIIGIYYFTDYNSSIDKELSYLGLATVNYEIRPTSQRILLIIYEHYFYISFITLLIFVMKFSSISRDRRSVFIKKILKT